MSTPRAEDGEEVPLEEVVVPDNCAASCVTCGTDEDGNSWPLATSISCLVGAGCVVLPDEDFDEIVDRVKSPTDERPTTLDSH